MNCHLANKHTKAAARAVDKCKMCDKGFHSFYWLREQKRKDQGAQRGSGAQNVDVTQLMGDADDNSLKWELGTCKHFLVDSETENGRHRVYNFAMETLDPNHLFETLVVVFDSLKWAAKLNVLFDFWLKSAEDGSCRYYYANEKKTLMERSKLVATTEDLKKIKNLLGNMDGIESCTTERANTRRKIYRLDESYTFCSNTQRRSHGLQRHCSARSTTEKSFRQLFNISG